MKSSLDLKRKTQFCKNDKFCPKINNKFNSIPFKITKKFFWDLTFDIWFKIHLGERKFLKSHKDIKTYCKATEIKATWTARARQSRSGLIMSRRLYPKLAEWTVLWAPSLWASENPLLNSYTLPTQWFLNTIHPKRNCAEITLRWT